MNPYINEMGIKGWITIPSVVAVALPASGILCHRSWLPPGGLSSRGRSQIFVPTAEHGTVPPIRIPDTDSTSTNNVSAACSAWLRLSTHTAQLIWAPAEGRITHLLQYFTSCKKEESTSSTTWRAPQPLLLSVAFLSCSISLLDNMQLVILASVLLFCNVSSAFKFVVNNRIGGGSGTSPLQAFNEPVSTRGASLWLRYAVPSTSDF